MQQLIHPHSTSQRRNCTSLCLHRDLSLASTSPIPPTTYLSIRTSRSPHSFSICMHESCVLLNQCQLGGTRNSPQISDIRKEVSQVLEENTFEQPLVLVTCPGLITAFDENAVVGWD